MNRYIIGVIAVAISAAVGFKPIPLATTTLYFDGNVFNSGEVKDQSRWAEDNSNGPCSGSNQACAMTVDLTDVTGSAGHRVLNSSRITLGANGNSSTGYFPSKSGGSSLNPITVINKN